MDQPSDLTLADGVATLDDPRPAFLLEVLQVVSMPCLGWSCQPRITEHDVHPVFRRYWGPCDRTCAKGDACTPESPGNRATGACCNTLWRWQSATQGNTHLPSIAKQHMKRVGTMDPSRNPVAILGTRMDEYSARIQPPVAGIEVEADDISGDREPPGEAQRGANAVGDEAGDTRCRQ